MSSADTDAPTDASDETAEQEVHETDEAREALLAEIAEILGDDLLESHVDPGRELYIRVPAAAWKSVHHRLRDQAGLKFFEFLSAIDWLPSPFGKSEDATADAGVPVTTIDASEIEQGYAGGETRFQVFTRLVDITRPNSLGVVIKADVEDPREADGSQLETIIAIFPGANWHEREIHEMFGIRFDGHPYLEALYLPSGFEGNPLRKDFPLLARQVKPWPGIVDVEPMPDDDDEDSDAAEGGDDA